MVNISLLVEDENKLQINSIDNTSMSWKANIFKHFKNSEKNSAYTLQKNNK